MQTLEVTSRTDDGQLVTDFLQTYGAFVQSYRLYPTDSDLMKEAIRNLHLQAERCFAWRNPISLMVIRERLYFEEFLIKSGNTLVATLIDNMLDRLIRKIIIYKGVEDRELFAMAELLNMPPVALRDAGGPEAVLAEDLHVTNIVAVELSMFFTQEVQDPNSWQAAMQKAGLDVEEVSLMLQGPDRPGMQVDVDRGGRMSVRGFRFARQEFLQLVEILLNPEVLAKMTIDLASVPTEEGPLVDPAEILRINTRIENILAFRSSYPETQIVQRMGEAMRLLDQNLRVAVLAESLRRRLQGLQIANLEIYRFTTQEYAKAILSLAAENVAVGRCVAFRPAAMAKIEPFIKQLAAEYLSGNGRRSAALCSELQTSRAIRLLPVDHDQQLGALAAWVAGAVPDDAQKNIEALLNKMKHQIEIGYANTVLGLMPLTDDERRLQQVVTNFFEQIHQLLETRQIEASLLLTRFRELVEKQGEQKQQIMTMTAAQQERELISRLLSLYGNVSLEENRATLVKMMPVIQKLGRDTIRDMLASCYLENRRTSTEQIASLVEPLRQDVIAILDEMLDENNENFAAKHFFKALNLFLALQKNLSEDLVARWLNTPSAAVRKAFLARWCTASSDERVKIVYRSVLTNDEGRYTAEEQIIAAYALGRTCDAESVPLLERLFRRRSIFQKKEPKELRLAALYAWAWIEGPKDRRKIAEYYKSIVGRNLKHD